VATEASDLNAPASDFHERVTELVAGEQFTLTQAEKDGMLLEILKPLCAEVAAACPAYGRFLVRLGQPIIDWQRVADVPPLPVTMFKKFALSAVPEEQVVRELHSSSTTGQSPSRIFIDKTTAFRQARALVSILKDAIGGARRPYLVLDAPESVGDGDTLTARGAAIRGIGNFASTTTFAMRQGGDGAIDPDWDAVAAFFEEHGDGPVLIFGFTFIVWSRFVLEAEARGLNFRASEAQLLHSGGWKKLTADAVTKDEFNARTGAVLGMPPAGSLDFYGMVEQVGTVFVDCAAGNKHAPAFADVVIRRPHTLEPVAPGEVGIIEVVSVLPTSYPGQALITEDQGELGGVDDCPCGRKGQYFRFTSRVERVEVRGCGDTFADNPAAASTAEAPDA
jgi:hypothetical protein